MLTAAIRVLARSAALQLEEVAANTPRATAAWKGKGRAVDDGEIGNGTRQQWGWSREAVDLRVKEEEVGGPVEEESRGSPIPERLPASLREPKTIQPGLKAQPDVETLPSKLPDSIRNPTTLGGSPTASTSATVEALTAESGMNSMADPQAASVASTSSSPTFKESLTSHPEHEISPSDSEVASAVTPASVFSDPVADSSSVTASPSSPDLPVEPLGADSALKETILEQDDDTPVMLRASKVPSSRLGRLFHYGSLAASLSFGAATESLRRSTGSGGQGSVFMSDANVRRLVATLGRMRGAALKLGQFMSIQDNHMLPVEIEKVLQQVQAHANYMPDWQMEKVMSTEFGSDWQSLFSSFDRVPVASASIGQVHKGVLASTGLPVAIKIQFPGIAGSINSDLANLSILIRSSALLPKGLYLQNTIAVMRRELEDECDYIREAAAGRKFEEYLKDDEFFVVPKVVDEATTGKVLTTEWMSGKPLSRMKGMSQETRDKIGTNVLRLCLQELFQFRFMQTDPNWANFLYETSNEKLQLIDFGASREYTKEFMDGWYRLLRAALEGDREVMKLESEKLGYLTGEENEEMLKAHLDSMALLASPFSHEGSYPFANQTITNSVRELIPIMLKYRLTPPPPETYSLNRKLSGAFLMCARLGANVDCRKLWEENVAGYKEG